MRILTDTAALLFFGVLLFIRMIEDFVKLGRSLFTGIE